MRTSVVVLACSSLLWTSCSKDSNKTDNPNAPSTDALWAMAPASTDIGVVVAPGTGKTLLAAWSTLESSIARQPAGAMIRDAIRKELPPQVLDPQAHEKMGLDLGLGVAVFVTTDDEIVLIGPVKNREAFRTTLGGKAEGDMDVFEKPRCRMINDLYTCSTNPELLTQAGKSDALAKKVAARPASLRGHIEVHVESSRLARIDDLPLTQFFKNPGAVQAAIQMEHGAFTARAHLPATPGTPLVAAFATVPDTLAKDAVQNKKAPGMWRLRVPVGELIPKDKAAAELAPAAALVAGFDPRRDLLDNLTGEMIMYSLPTGMNVSLEVGLNDGKRLQTLVTTLCSFAKAAKLPVDIEMKGESCVATIDPAEIKRLERLLAAIPFDDRITVAVTATDKAVGVHLAMAEQGKAVEVELAPMARELMTESWTWSMWGGGGVSLEALDPTMMAALKTEPKAYAAAMFTLWMLGHITETGAGVAVRDDGLHAVMHLGTQWGNPDPVLQEFQKHLGDMLAGDASAADKIRALAEKSPDTPLGRSMQSGMAGKGALVAGIGVAAAMAIPAFVKYQQKSKASEASMFLRRLHDGARVHYMAPPAGAAPSFPAESVGPTPALGTCCDQGGKCQPDASLWTHPTWAALGFSVDDPHYYSYQYEVVDRNKEFVVRAIGDLDCDGTYSTFEMRGVVDDSGGLPGMAEIMTTNETE